MAHKAKIAAAAGAALLMTGCVSVAVPGLVPKMPWQSDPDPAITQAPYDDGAPPSSDSVTTAEPTTYAPPPPATTSFAPRTTPPRAASSINPADCTVEEILVQFVTDPQNSGQDHSAYLVWMTNISTRRCELLGYPGVDFMSGPDGEQVGHEGFRDRVYTPSRFAIAPGQRGVAEVRMLNANVVPGCAPVTVPGVRIYVPNTGRPQFFPVPLQACSNPQAIQLTVRATRRA